MNKRKVLLKLALKFEKSEQQILQANKKDLEEVEKLGRDKAFLDRLEINDRRFKEMVAGVRLVANLKEPVGEILEQRKLKNGLLLKKVRVAIGTILVIYEARPNVTVEAFSLAFMAGNKIVLKGGKEAERTNLALVKVIRRVLRDGGNEDYIEYIKGSDREELSKLLKSEAKIDLVIPRGGKALVGFVRKYARMPVLSHAEGVDHIYVDKSADLNMAVKIVKDSKTNRPGTCNSVDTVLVHEDIAGEFLSRLEKALAGVVKLHKDRQSWGREFLSLSMGVKVVADVEEAIKFIDKYGSGHTEGVVVKDKGVCDQFVSDVDAAAVMVNCSTRLHDGSVFGMGAEMGIATGKFHARGPVGLEELTIYKWVIYGKGQIRSNYEEI